MIKLKNYRYEIKPEIIMVKKKKKTKKKARKHQTPLDKIKKQLEKLEALHDKENAVVETINDLIDEAQDDEDYDFDKWEGTDPD